MTKYAEMILNIINESHDHMTAEQIFLTLKEAEPKVVLATVYNNLNLLCSEGMIRRVAIEGSPDRYDRIVRHDHLVCRQCGKLSDISFDDLTKKLEKQLGENILSYDLKVFYLCSNCKLQKDIPENGRILPKQTGSTESRLKNTNINHKEGV